ncbi:MAG: hypothetical protein OZ924_17205 [Burkholderiaceae bacterium]|nr:hypothetical protein [Burkholderiaceae bacterium]
MTIVDQSTTRDGTRRREWVRAAASGVLGMLGLLLLYFGVLGAVSGFAYALGQFTEFWPFVVALAAGFGTQVGIFAWLHRAVHAAHGSGKIVAASGTTSGVAMVSCCVHYLVNLLPALGAAGVVTFVSQYQITLLWVGLIANALGIAYMGRRAIVFVREMHHGLG